MKTDPQHMLPAHLPFYRKRLFWAIVLLGVTVFPYIYIGYYFIGHPQQQLLISMSNIFLLVFTLGSIVQSASTGLFLSLLIYAVLLYLALLRREINFYALASIIILLILNFFFTINFTI